MSSPIQFVTYIGLPTGDLQPVGTTHADGTVHVFSDTAITALSHYMKIGKIDPAGVYKFASHYYAGKYGKGPRRPPMCLCVQKYIKNEGV